MDKVLTARAWGYVKPLSGALAPEATCSIYGVYNAPVLLVHGATESDILAGLSLLAKSREVCEWKRTSGIEMFCEVNYETQCGLKLELYDLPTSEGQKDRPCWCGRRVEVKE